MLSLLPTLGDQILHEMNIEEGWAKLQETRKLEKIETKLRKEREMAALLREEQEALDQLKEYNTTSDSVVIVEHEQDDTMNDTVKQEKTPEKPVEVDSSVGSLAASFVAEKDKPLPAGILSKKEKNLLWDEIKTMSECFYKGPLSFSFSFCLHNIQLYLFLSF